MSMFDNWAGSRNLAVSLQLERRLFSDNAATRRMHALLARFICVE